MNDFFDEIQAELKAERTKALWKRLAPFVYGGAGLIVVATAGNELLQSLHTGKIEENGKIFEAGLNAMIDRDDELARQSFAQASARGGQLAPLVSHYLAALEMRSIAEDDSEEENEKEPSPEEQEQKNQQQQEARAQAATALWQQAGTKTPLERLATVKAGYLEADTLSLDELQERLAALIDSGGRFALLARELLAAKAFYTGDKELARSEYMAIIDDEDSWSEIRQRANMGLDMLKATPTPDEMAKIEAEAKAKAEEEAKAKAEEEEKAKAEAQQAEEEASSETEQATTAQALAPASPSLKSVLSQQ